MSNDGLGEGAALRQVVRRIDQAQVNRYADAVGDHNPIHIDEDFARSTPFGGTIIHGMLVLALLSESLTATFGPRWGQSSRLKVRFRAPARPGDTITAGGVVQRIREDGAVRQADCSLECRNQADEILITGEARVVLGEDGGGP